MPKTWWCGRCARLTACVRLWLGIWGGSGAGNCYDWWAWASAGCS